MKIIGVTGSIATGKSTVTKLLQEVTGAMVVDADAIVHALYEDPHVIKDVKALFPGAVVQHSIDRSVLRKEVFDDDTKLKKLEGLIHPLFRKSLEKHIHDARKADYRYIVLDIPLLFENGLDRFCDITIVADCPYEVQRARALERSGMNQVTLDKILLRQMPQDEKKQRADFILDTTQSKDHLSLQLKKIIE